MITPLPPQKTGIGDYAAGLIRGLQNFGDEIGSIRLGTAARN
jgi:hypothetical protein